MSADESITSLSEAVAVYGALPMPVVPESRTLVQQMVDALNGHDCPPPGESPMEAVTRFAVRLMDAEARIAELEAELLVANGVLEDVARARRDACPCAADRPHQVGCPRDGVPVAVVREREPEFYGALHHSYRVGHDLPETGGA